MIINKKKDKDKIQKILLLTATGQFNLGDELILEQEYRILKKQYPKAKYVIFTYVSDSSNLKKLENIIFVHYFPYQIRKNPIANFLYLYQNIWHFWTANLVIIGGGGLFYQCEVQKTKYPLTLWKLRILFLKLLQKSVIFFSLGLQLSQQKIKQNLFLFRGKKIKLSIREKTLQKTFQSLGVDSTYLPDPVFNYIPIKKKKSKKYVCLALRSGYLKTQDVYRMINFLQREHFSIYLLPHSFHPTDKLANDYLFLKEFATKYDLPISKNMQESLEMYYQAKLVIAMRKHSMVLSIQHQIPFIGLSYSQKTHNLLKEFDYNYFLKTEEFEIEKFKKIFETKVRNQESIKLHLKQKSLEATEIFTQNLKKLKLP